MKAGRRGARAHIIALGASAAVLALGFALETDGERVFVGGFALPAVCWWKSTPLGSCPGCGITRSVVAICHLQWGNGFRLHPAGPLIVALALMEIPYRLAHLGRIRNRSLLAAGAASERILLAMALLISLAAWL